MKASVIISTYNNLDDLRLLLPSLERQALGHHEMEAVIRDDGSSDDAHAWIKSRYPWVRLMRGDNIGFSASNNMAVRQATGDILVFVNADTILDQNFIAAGLQAFEQDPLLGGLNSNMIMPWVMDLPAFLDGDRPAAAHGFFLNRYGFADYRKVSGNRCGTLFLSGGGCFLRRAALGDDLPFSEDLWGGTAYCEDLDLSLRLLAKKWRLCFEPAAVLYHNQRPIQGPGSRQLRKFFRVSTNRITVYAINLSLSCFLQFVPGLFYGLFRKIDSLPLPGKNKRNARFAVAMTIPLFLMILPYWVYRNLRSGTVRNPIRDFSLLKRSFK